MIPAQSDAVQDTLVMALNISFWTEVFYKEACMLMSAAYQLIKVNQKHIPSRPTSRLKALCFNIVLTSLIEYYMCGRIGSGSGSVSTNRLCQSVAESIFQSVADLLPVTPKSLTRLAGRPFFLHIDFCRSKA